MELRDWLAGGAAAAVLGMSPALAQAPRSLFEAMPEPAAQPFAVVTMPKESPPDLRPTVPPPTPPFRPATLARATVIEVPAPVDGPPDAAVSRRGDGASAGPLPPAKPAYLRERFASLDAAPGTPAVQAATPPPFSLFAPAQPASPATDAPLPPQRPMSAAERRRADREAALQAAAPAEAAAVATPTFATNPIMTLFGAVPAQNRGEALPPVAGRGQIDAWVSHHARLNHVPESLVHRIIVRESRYNPRAVGRGGAMGLMQIKTATARGVGYAGGPAGLLDAETNLTYGIKYLAGAWRVAGGSHDRAVSHYARGYYYEAKRRGLGGGSEPGTTAAVASQPPSFLSLFSRQAAAQ